MEVHGTGDWQPPWWIVGTRMIATKNCCWEATLTSGWNEERDGSGGRKRSDRSENMDYLGQQRMSMNVLLEHWPEIEICTSS